VTAAFLVRDQAATDLEHQEAIRYRMISH
jgi:hypothetical protein